MVVVYLRLRAALQLRLDGPGEQWLSVFLEDGVCHEGVFILCVNEEAVHVEETCSYAGETGGLLDSCSSGYMVLESRALV